MGERSPSTLVVTEANRDAVNLLQCWRRWPGGALALVGPPGAGKTHLGLAWAVETGARQLRADAAPEQAATAFDEGGGCVFVDDASGVGNEAMLWRLLDLARSQAGAVLLAASAPPEAWRVASPDLASRLTALPVARLYEPDEALLNLVLRRICREQFIQLSDSAANYLVPRMPRTFAAAREIAAVLDAELKRGSRPVTVKAAKDALEKAQTVWSGDG